MTTTRIHRILDLISIPGFDCYYGRLVASGKLGVPTAKEARQDYLASIESHLRGEL